MEKRRIANILFMVIVLSPVLLAQEEVENYNDRESLDLKVHLDAALAVTVNSPQEKINELKVDLSFFPRENDFQTIQSLTHQSFPQAGITSSDKYTSFVWRDIAQSQQVKYGVDAVVRTSNIILPAAKRIPFPLMDIDNDHLKYTQPTPFIDITPEIELKAREIIGGETDMMLVIFKIADWTKNNIEYDLSTLTADVVQKSSWVLANKRGVCDELTNLFISMLRSVGIPARFVSGMVYSNLDNKWGPHGWAEVYIPEVGWVPYDVTFGQYGWIDPSHVKLKDDKDSGSPSAEYSWKSQAQNNVQVQPANLAASLVKRGKQIDPVLSVQVEPYRKAVKPGSVVPLLVTIANPTSFYVSPTVVVRKAPDIEGSNVRHILLKPRETKTIGWLLHIPEDADDGYIYTSTLEVSATFGNTASSQIKYAHEYDGFSRQQAESIINSLEKQAQKNKLETASFSCFPDKQIYYTNDTITIACSLKSIDLQALSLNACVRTVCQQFTLLPKQEKQIAFTMTAEQSGRLVATLEDPSRVTYTPIDINVISIPDITITHVSPAQAAFNEKVQLSFTIETTSPIKNVQIDFGFNQLAFESIEESREIQVSTSGRNLVNGLGFTMVYRDEKGELYETRRKVDMQVLNIPWHAKIIFWIAEFFQ